MYIDCFSMVVAQLNPAALWAMSRLDPSVESPIQFHSIFTQIYPNPLRERFTSPFYPSPGGRVDTPRKARGSFWPQKCDPRRIQKSPKK